MKQIETFLEQKRKKSPQEKPAGISISILFMIT